MRGKKKRKPDILKDVKLFAGIMVSFFIGFLCISKAQALTLNVVDPNGQQVTAYRWLVEEDATYHVNPGVPDPNTLAVGFHSSYMPVVAKGDEATPPTNLALDPAKHYFVSILPDSGFSIGGAPLQPGQETLTITVNAQPIPTAQIRIFVFEDNQPINNAPDMPEEQGLGGFSIVLEDAGGRYGISGGAQMLDAFGNPLGTLYAKDKDGNAVLDPDGVPVVATDPHGEPIIEPLVTGACPGDACGQLTIKNLAPGKYGVQAIPPAGEGWSQTSTIEGTKVIDVWVKANEPPFFAEFGPPGFHAAIGFVKPVNDATRLTGGSTIAGQVVNLHLSRPPAYAFYNGGPLEHTTAWIGLNDFGAGAGKGIYAQRANGDGTFSIPNVPPGNYQLVVWDDALDVIFSFKGITVNPDGSCNTLNGSCNLGDVPVFQWFTRLENHVFNDENENGFRDAGERGIPEQAVNIRWRDGTVYQSFPTDGEGYVPFDEIFPFFSWLVAEVDFARFKATGATIVVDDGGPINPADPWTFGGQLNPQPQSENNFGPYRTELGPVLTQAFQGFLGQTSEILWGKKAYGPNENGGISGIVYYATTRAEDDPRYAAAEPWEPGIPGVTVNLYDNSGALVNTTTTDSWDNSLPTGCQGEPFIFQGQTTDCFDGLRVFNQVRPGVFDGGYAFNGSCLDPAGLAVTDPAGDVDNDTIQNSVDPDLLLPAAGCSAVLPPGEYIVEVVPPAGYEIVKEEDRNVDFGDSYVPSPLLLPPVCVGEPHLVPSEFSLFPLQDELGNNVPPYMTGEMTPLCSKKRIFLSNGMNAAADFFVFTEVPIAGHLFGFILDDTANEFDPTSPQFGEKFAPPWLPVSIRDWTGREIGRTYSDQFGRYNALVPSTFTTNLPAPSGMSPNMLITCMNDPRLPDGTPDPNFNPQYSTFCYTFQYMPGATTYLDTPVVPVAAFAGPDQSPLDCEFRDGTPKIKSASAPNNGVGGGPFVPEADGVQAVTIESLGAAVTVPNPGYCPGPPLAKDCPVVDTRKTISRDYSFGATPGSVTIGDVALQNVVWGADVITGTIAQGTTTGQLTVTRGDNGRSTITGVTFQVGLRSESLVKPVLPGESIQKAIDEAGPRDLILVAPGTYEEILIMWKPVQLQGWGEGSTTINAVKAPTEKLALWRAKVRSLLDPNLDGNPADALVDLLPAQEIAFGGIEPDALFTEEGAGVLVLAPSNSLDRFDRDVNHGSRIDGFTITSADTGGGIVANGFVDFLDISNNRIINNSGFFGGGIRIGHPDLALDKGNNPLNGVELMYQDADNDNISIRHNHITQNGGLGGAGGGVSLCTGSDNYQVTDNFICGNFSLRDGGGIGHLGLSDNGLIAGNSILFNENFNQGLTVSGGGIFIGGQVPLGNDILTPGTGSVTVSNNLIQGNAAGAGDGGGLRISRVNGQDVASNTTQPDRWYTVDIINNMIVNNIAALAGGGMSMQDAVKLNIIHNTIANNDSTATASEAFAADPNQSNPQPAGLVSYAHRPELTAAAAGIGTFTDPALYDNIIRHNRSFFFFGDLTGIIPAYKLLPDPATPVYDDLAVLGTAVPETLNPQNCILTDTAGYDPSNLMADPLYVAEYFNGNRDASVAFPEATTAIEVPPAFDEGGNFIRVRFGPLTRTVFDANANEWVLRGDYHISQASPAIDAGLDVTASFPAAATDYDGQVRPFGPTVDIGADEVQVVFVDLCEGDFNNDGTVNITDYLVILGELNRTDCSAANPCVADLNNDGRVDSLDLEIFNADWGRTDCPVN